MITKRAQHFNAWLDALVAGGAPNTGAPDADTDSMRNAARKVQSAAQESLHRPDHRSLPSDWEDFMSAHNLTLEEPITTRTSATPDWKTSASSTRTPATPASIPPSHTSRSTWWTKGSSAFLTLLLIAALGAGAWLAADRFNLGGFSQNDPPESIPFGGFVQDEATPEPVAELDPASIATADQCTIEPLTIDQVVAYVYNPNLDVTPTADGSPEALSPEEAEAVADTVHDPAYASPEALAGATTTFHMFEACIEANSYFQIWALLDPHLLYESIDSVLPPLTGEQEFRTMLEDLEANGPGEPMDHERPFVSPEFSMFTGSRVGDGRISRVVDQNLDNTWMPTETYLVTGYVSFLPGGTQLPELQASIYDSDFDGTPEPLVGFDPRMKQPSCFTIAFYWSDARNMWLIQSAPACG